MILSKRAVLKTVYSLAVEKSFAGSDRMAAAAERNKKYVKSTEGK